jgi:hypothetical protein
MWVSLILKVRDSWGDLYGKSFGATDEIQAKSLPENLEEAKEQYALCMPTSRVPDRSQASRPFSSSVGQDADPDSSSKSQDRHPTLRQRSPYQSRLESILMAHNLHMSLGKGENTISPFGELKSG